MNICAQCNSPVKDKDVRCNCGSTTFRIEKERQIPCSSCGENNPPRRGECWVCHTQLTHY